MATEMIPLLPKDIPLKTSLMDSEFGSIETERITKNILVIQQKMNPEQWTPFSLEDYKKHCTHQVNDEREGGVLEALVKGGKPVWNTTAYLQPGYLEKEGSMYKVTEKLIKVYRDQMKKE